MKKGRFDDGNFTIPPPCGSGGFRGDVCMSHSRPWLSDSRPPEITRTRIYTATRGRIMEFRSFIGNRAYDNYAYTSSIPSPSPTYISSFRSLFVPIGEVCASADDDGRRWLGLMKPKELFPMSLVRVKAPVSWAVLVASRVSCLNFLKMTPGWMWGANTTVTFCWFRC